MAMAMMIVVGAAPTGPLRRPRDSASFDDDIAGHGNAARCDTLATSGTYPPAGAVSANPVRSRSCPATVMPLDGDEPGRLLRTERTQPSEEGKFVRRSRRATSLRLRGGFSCPEGPWSER